MIEQAHENGGTTLEQRQLAARDALIDAANNGMLSLTTGPMTLQALLVRVMGVEDYLTCQLAMRWHICATPNNLWSGLECFDGILLAREERPGDQPPLRARREVRHDDGCHLHIAG